MTDQSMVFEGISTEEKMQTEEALAALAQAGVQLLEGSRCTRYANGWLETCVVAPGGRGEFRMGLLFKPDTNGFEVRLSYDPPAS